MFVSGRLIPMMGGYTFPNLLSLLDNDVRLVAVTHCSNLVGEINPVRQIANATHEARILLVDGVSYCPHGFHVDALGADIYLFSTYKLTVLIRVLWLFETLRAICLRLVYFFNHDNPMKWMVPQDRSCTNGRGEWSD